MFDQPATPKINRLNAIRALMVAFIGLGTGVGLLTIAREGIAQPAPQSQPTSQTSPPDGNKVDLNSPLPADAQQQQPREKFAIKNPDRRIFSQIEDFKPVASQAENREEYDAWVEVVMQAKQFSAAELEQSGIRDLTVIDFLKQYRSAYRCNMPIRFDGKLVCIRRLPAPQFFADNPQSSIKELYEARFVPIDESPNMPVSMVFLELPEAFAAVRQKAPKEWLDANNWISASGYFFKVMSVPGEQGKTVKMPVFVGKSITPLPGPPKPSGDDPTVIEHKKLFDFIRDDSRMIRASPTDLSWPEVAAYNRVLLHASRFSAEELERHALTDVKFADLLQAVRVDYKLKDIKLEGRLISLRRMEVNDELRAAGINQVFEGWLVPANEPRGNPICIVFTEPLDGVEPDGRVSVWVSFAGYSFKLMRYESAEKDADDPNQFVVKKAPLLIGKSPIRRPDPDRPTALSWGIFMQTATIVGALLIVAGGGLAWWYRSGDRKARTAINTVRSQNPFDPTNRSPVA